LETAETRIEDMKAQLTNVLDQVAETQSIRRLLVDTDEKMKTAELQVSQLQEKLVNLQSQLAMKGNQQLQIIRGIGPTYAKRLHEMGIHTFADLAQQTPEKLAEIVKLRSWQQQSPAAWIEEAQKLINPPDTDSE
jgi:predicted flap endonuclease-1-like 5' DNA nuclease